LETTGGLAEAASLPWRPRTHAGTLRRQELRWTAWTSWVVVVFTAPGVALIAIEPLAFPAALLCFAHAWAVPWIQARRGATWIVPIGSDRSATRRRDSDAGAESTALGFLGDLVGHRQRELLRQTGVVLERGSLGTWLVGEQGAILVRPGGRRLDCWCVRVADHSDLPAGDRVAHLLLALREDEGGFAKVANFGFSGAWWRVRRHLPTAARPALDAARRAARSG
jgi:hypothetical protein